MIRQSFLLVVGASLILRALNPEPVMAEAPDALTVDLSRSYGAMQITCLYVKISELRKEIAVITLKQFNKGIADKWGDATARELRSRVLMDYPSCRSIMPD